MTDKQLLMALPHFNFANILSAACKDMKATQVRPGLYHDAVMMSG